MSVSVVIPTYRAGAFIRGTLESVFSQTRLPDEVIVVDDCSPDDTVEIVQETVPVAPVPVRVILLPKNSGGPARPLNVGIRAASGRFIATLDHDDRMLAFRLEQQLALCERYPQLGLCTGALDRLDRQCENSKAAYSNVIAPIPREAISGGYVIRRTEAHRATVNIGCFVRSCSTLTFPKTTWEAVHGFDESVRSCIDLAFLVKVTRQFDIGGMEEAMIEYSVDHMSLSFTAPSEVLTGDELRAYSQIDRRLLDRSLRQRYDSMMSTLHSDMAYWHRERGRYLGSMWEYGQSLRCQINRKSIAGIAKLFPHWGRFQVRKFKARQA